MIDDAERQRLRALAKAATSGPWWQGGPDGSIHAPTGRVCTIERQANGEYIAAANPQQVLALLDEIDRLHAELAECRAARDAGK